MVVSSSSRRNRFSNHFKFFPQQQFRQRVLKSSSSGKSSKTLQSFIHHLHHSSQKTDFYLILTLAAWVGILMTMTLLYIIYWILDRVLGIDEDEVFTPFTAIFFILFIFFEIQSTVSLWFLAFVRDWSRAIAGKQLVAVLPPPQQPLGDKQQNHHQKQEQHQSFVEDAETGRAVMAEDDFASLDAGLPKLTYSPVKGVPGGGGGVSIGIRKKLVRYIKASSATSDSITPSELKQYTDDESVSANGV